MGEPPPAYSETLPPSDKAGSGFYPSAPPQMPPLPNQMPPPMAPPPPPSMYSDAPRAVPQTTVFIGTLALNADPCRMVCPYCTHEIVTRIAPRSGLLTWLLCGGLAFFGCWICCCIPFCTESCQDIEHFCPKCNRFLGTYKRI